MAIVVAATVTGCRTQEPTVTSNDATTHAEVSTALTRLNELLATRNRAIVDEFAAMPDVMLLGSDPGEVAVGRGNMVALFDAVFALPFQISWDWAQTRVSSEGDIAWVFAEGDVVMKGADGETRKPYRMTGVLQRLDGEWKWRQFHGSEPAAP